VDVAVKESVNVIEGVAVSVNDDVEVKVYVGVKV
jgi:hypothetical protein